MNGKATTDRAAGDLASALLTLDRCWGSAAGPADAAGLQAARERLSVLWEYEELRSDAVSAAISRGIRVKRFWPEFAPPAAAVERG